MDLEKRVSTLEQEMKILKNQIQKSLLDIQEQLLTNTYPSLRSGEESAANGSSHVAEPNGGSPNGRQPTPAETLNGTTPVQKVTLEELRAPEKTADSEPPASTSEPAAELDSFEFWVNWIDDNVGKFGLERTRKLAQIRLKQSQPEMIGVVEQILALYEDNPANTDAGQGADLG